MSSSHSRRLRAELAIAWRYLRSVRDDALIHQLSRITVAGLALGVAALILALSVLTGFQEHLLGDVLERSPDLQVEWPGLDMSDPAASSLLNSLRAIEGVTDVQHLRQGQGWMRVRGEPRPVEVIAYENEVPPWMKPSETRDVSEDNSGGSKASQSRPELGALGGIHIPQSLADSWGIELGDVIEVITPRRTFSPLGREIPSRRYLPVAGFLSGSRIEEVIRDRIAIRLRAGKALLGTGGAAIDLTLASKADEQLVRDQVETLVQAAASATSVDGRAEANSARSLTTPRIVTWRDRHASLLFVLKLEKAAVFLSVTLIVLVASFALVSALALILSAKRRELGLLSAVGMSPRRIRRLFLILGTMLAGSGALSGAILGWALAVGLDRFEVIPLPGDLYVVDHVPFVVHAPELLSVFAATLIVTIVAAAFGARGASTWTPIEALRR